MTLVTCPRCKSKDENLEIKRCVTHGNHFELCENEGCDGRISYPLMTKGDKTSWEDLID